MPRDSKRDGKHTPSLAVQETLSVEIELRTSLPDLLMHWKLTNQRQKINNNRYVIGSLPNLKWQLHEERSSLNEASCVGHPRHHRLRLRFSLIFFYSLERQLLRVKA